MLHLFDEENRREYYRKIQNKATENRVKIMGKAKKGMAIRGVPQLSVHRLHMEDKRSPMKSLPLR